VSRTRNPGRDSYVPLISHPAGNPTNFVNTSRSKPYERPPKSVIIQPDDRDVSPRKQVDGTTLGHLFQQLAPLTKDPSNFESAAAAICASFNLDPTTSAEIVASFKQQLPTDKSRGSMCV
jgi:hypothetical protein